MSPFFCGLNITMGHNDFTKYHPYIVNAGKHLKWLPSDTEELYQENLVKQRDLLEKHNWLSTEIEYKFNSDGFRSEEFSSNGGGVMFLGCSLTFGIGLPLQHTFPQIVSKELGLECLNLSLPASSNDTAFRLADLWIDRLNPSVVILLSPSETRFELLIHDSTSNEIEARFVTTMDQLSNTTTELHWMDTDQNGQINRRKNKLAIQKICDDRDVKFLQDDTENLVIMDLARDLLHPGVKSNRLFAKKLLKILKETEK